MNYRHAYHAGNFADVYKHATLIALLESFKAKATPFCYVDTHAGRGVYDLDGERALKTREAVDGVLRLLALQSVPAPLRAYVDLVRSLRAQDGAGGQRYPGSPLVADGLLRKCDRAVLCELQADEARALRSLFRHRPSFHVHQRDGYEALGALLPPREKRGLVLIDPPFEAQKEEFRVIEQALDEALARWPTGRYAVWYPIKLGRDIQPFHRWLKRRCPGKWLIGEFLVHPDNTGERLNGCGLAVINPPWQFERTLDALLNVLCRHLGQDGFADRRVHFPD
ncbi:MAG TPA: 23S rRNA (adenine(2030)-N(6))-methyltransferase RlmJ [Oleiagrimonas sp.]|nr:23S rRNA (adenine(2030)-N(6))-methyltransferase RlmJ [Oleiagrimonas sp.]